MKKVSPKELRRYPHEIRDRALPAMSREVPPAISQGGGAEGKHAFNSVEVVSRIFG